MNLREVVTAIVETLVGPRIEAGVPYAARVVTQRADGTLDIVPEKTTLDAMTEVPIRYGLPGESAKVKPGARCFFEFLEGDRSQPIVIGWGAGHVPTEVTIDADRVRIAGDRKIARQGDLVSVTLTSVHVGALMGGTPFLNVAGSILTGSDTGTVK